MKNERDGGRDFQRGGKVFVDAICLLCYLSPRQVQIWSLSFPASLHIRFPFQTQTHTSIHTDANFVSFHLSLNRFSFPLFLSKPLLPNSQMSGPAHTHKDTHKQTYISIKPWLSMMNVVTF